MTPITYLLLLYSFNCNKMSHKCTTGKTTQIQLGKKHEKVKSLLCTPLLYYASKMHFPNFLTLSRRSGFHSFFHSSREILVSLVYSPPFTEIQVNLCQKLLLLHQLTHNMTTDCSLNYKFSTGKFQAENMLRTCCVHELF